MSVKRTDKFSFKSQIVGARKNRLAKNENLEFLQQVSVNFMVVFSYIMQLPVALHPAALHKSPLSQHSLQAWKPWLTVGGVYWLHI